MFRIGSALFIPGYLTVTLYRRFASSRSDGNALLMILLSISTHVSPSVPRLIWKGTDFVP